MIFDHVVILRFNIRSKKNNNSIMYLLKFFNSYQIFLMSRIGDFCLKSFKIVKSSPGTNSFSKWFSYMLIYAYCYSEVTIIMNGSLLKIVHISNNLQLYYQASSLAIKWILYLNRIFFYIIHFSSDLKSYHQVDPSCIYQTSVDERNHTKKCSFCYVILPQTPE